MTYVNTIRIIGLIFFVALLMLAPWFGWSVWRDHKQDQAEYRGPR